MKNQIYILSNSMQLENYPLPGLDWTNKFYEENNLIYFTIQYKDILS